MVVEFNTRWWCLPKQVLTDDVLPIPRRWRRVETNKFIVESCSHLFDTSRHLGELLLPLVKHSRIACNDTHTHTWIRNMWSTHCHLTIPRIILAIRMPCLGGFYQTKRVINNTWSLQKHHLTYWIHRTNDQCNLALDRSSNLRRLTNHWSTTTTLTIETKVLGKRLGQEHREPLLFKVANRPLHNKHRHQHSRIVEKWRKYRIIEEVPCGKTLVGRVEEWQMVLFLHNFRDEFPLILRRIDT